MDLPAIDNLGSHPITFDSRDASFSSVDSRASIADYSSPRKAIGTLLPTPEAWAAVKKQLSMSPRASPRQTPRDKGAPDLQIAAQLADARAKSPTAMAHSYLSFAEQQQQEQQLLREQPEQRSSLTEFLQKLEGVDALASITITHSPRKSTTPEGTQYPMAASDGGAGSQELPAGTGTAESLPSALALHEASTSTTTSTTATSPQRAPASTTSSAYAAADSSTSTSLLVLPTQQQEATGPAPTTTTGMPAARSDYIITQRASNSSTTATRSSTLSSISEIEPSPSCSNLEQLAYAQQRPEQPAKKGITAQQLKQLRMEEAAGCMKMRAGRGGVVRDAAVGGRRPGKMQTLMSCLGCAVVDVQDVPLTESCPGSANPTAELIVLPEGVVREAQV